MTAVIVAYQNPDLDGVACALALESLEAPTWSARVLGRIDEETDIVLRSLCLPRPPSLDNWCDIDRVWLVDTHHPLQLPADLPEELVVRITDHHLGGAASRYPNAEIQNDLVGAAATLVAERFLKESVAPSNAIAQLLQAAILSNTLDFRAPATSERDRQAYEKLRAISPLSSDVVARMKAARSTLLNLSTKELLNRDTKLFTSANGKVIAISQLESDGALSLLERANLTNDLLAFGESRGSSAVVLNLVDTSLCKSAIVTTDVSLRVVLGQHLGAPADNAGVIHCNRLLQRKTDIVPVISN